LPRCIRAKDLIQLLGPYPASLLPVWQALLRKAAILAVSIIAASCSRLPLRGPILLDQTSPRALCQSARSKSEDIRTHVTDARIILKTEDGRSRFRQVSMMMRPASLRFEVIDPFGRALFLIVSDGDLLTAYDITEGRCTIGHAGPDSLARFLPVPIAAEELLGLLAGAPAPECDTMEEEGAEHGLRRLRTGRREGKGHQILSIDPADLSCHSVKLYDPDGNLELTGEFSEFEQADGLTLPRRIRLTGPEAGRGETGFEMIFKYGDLIVNRPVEPALFSFAPPPWATIVDIDEGSSEGILP